MGRELTLEEQELNRQNEWLKRIEKLEREVGIGSGEEVEAQPTPAPSHNNAIQRRAISG